MEPKLLVLVVFIWAGCHVTEAQLIVPATLGTNITNTTCGISKLCVSSVSNCNPSGNSSCFFSSIQVNNQTATFELTGTTSGYVALVLTASNQSQGGAVVFICGNNNTNTANSNVFFQTYTLNGTTLTSANVSTVNSVQGALQQNQGLIQCTFNTTTNLIISNGNNFTISNTTSAYIAILNGSTNGTQLGNAAAVFNYSTPINLTNSTVIISSSSANTTNSTANTTNNSANTTNSTTNNTNNTVIVPNSSANTTNSTTNTTSNSANTTNSTTNTTSNSANTTNSTTNTTSNSANTTNSTTNTTSNSANTTNSTTNTTSNSANTTNSTTNTTSNSANTTNSTTNNTNSSANTTNSTANTTNSTNVSQLNITSNGCGSTKLCLLSPSACIPGASNCFFTSSKLNNQTFSFELSGPSSGYVALALSNQNSSYVFVCGNNNTNNGSSFFFQTNTQNGSVLTPANVSTVYGILGAVSQNQSLIQCIFNTNTSFNLNTTANTTSYNISILTGSTTGTQLGNASTRVATSTPVNLSNPSALSTASPSPSTTTASGTKSLVSQWTLVLALLLSAMSLHFVTSHSP